MKVRRKEFISDYAEHSSLSDEWADLGFIKCDGGNYLICLPCECDKEDCRGWAMVTPSEVLSHLELYAPSTLSAAYKAVVRGIENEAEEARLFGDDDEANG